MHWPGRPKANLDHVAIGPGGVLVIDAKNWSGAVTVRDGVLRSGTYRKDRELEGVAAATAAVAALLAPRHRALTRGLLCLVQQGVPPTRTVSGVLVVGRANLVDTVRALRTSLSPDDVTATASRLRALLSAPSSPAQLTTARLASSTGSFPVPHEPPARVRAATRPRQRHPAPAPSRRAPRRGAPTRSGAQQVLLVLLKLCLILWLLGIGSAALPHIIAAVISTAVPTPPAGTAPVTPGVAGSASPLR